MANNFQSDVDLKRIFNGKLFRVPDYQRGYSWQKEHIDELWDDLGCIFAGQRHYTGMITLTSSNNEDSWTGREGYCVVDGQQRLTTLVIAIKKILDRASELEIKELGGMPIEKIQEIYLFETKKNNKDIKSAVFSYSEGDPSKEFFECEILGFEYPRIADKTSYTQNISTAASELWAKIKMLDNAKLEELYKNITERLVFNEYFIEDDKEVSVVFESMNNRGKRLSTLELLKNRLIYLSEKIETGDDKKKKLRKIINDSWRIVYRELGSFGLAINNDADDEFLRNHWIIYFKYDRHKGKSYEDDLLRNEFSVTNSTTNMSFKKINDYVISVSKAVKHWRLMRQPQYADYPDSIKSELMRLNRVGFPFSFKPLVLALLTGRKPENDHKIVEILKKCDEYAFKIFSISQRLTNKGDSVFYKIAREHYMDNKDCDYILRTIDRELASNYRPTRFAEYLDELFEDDKCSGFYGWGTIRYFLFEYEEKLRTDSSKIEEKINWEKFAERTKKEYVTIEHIYPSDDGKPCWQKSFSQFDNKQKRYLKASLGNLLALSKSRNSSFQNNCFADKKDDGCGGGYCKGSYSELDVAQNKNWGAKQIKERGLKLLEFMEERWKINLANKEQLLHVNFVDDDGNLKRGE